MTITLTPTDAALILHGDGLAETFANLDAQVDGALPENIRLLYACGLAVTIPDPRRRILEFLETAASLAGFKDVHTFIESSLNREDISGPNDTKN